MSFLAAGTDISILVIDDEESIREVLAEFLSLKNYKVKTAANGFEALKIVEEENFDVVLLDIKMPGMDGIQVLRKFKELGVNSVFIMMTAFGTVETATEAFKLGAHDYLLKPFNSDMISNTINNAIEQRKLRLENIYLKSTVSLFDVAQAVENNSNSFSLIETLGDSIRKESGADIVSIFLFDETRNQFTNHHIFPSIATDIGLVDIERIVSILKKSEDILTTNQAYKIFFTKEPEKFLYSFMVIPLKRGKKILGFILLYSFNKKNIFTLGQKNFMKVFASYFSATLENTRLYSELLETFNQTMQGFAHALEAKDVYTQGHSERVTTYSVAIAYEMNLHATDELDKVDIDLVYKAGRLHDIGKIGLQYEKLNKAGKLTDEEFEMFKKHPTIGKKILEPIRFLSPVVPLVYYHHEKYDGKGYPEGLAGNDIPVGARILAIADTYDAMTSDRPYRKALSHQTAMDEIRRYTGSQFDPLIVEHFAVAIEKYREKCRDIGLDFPE